jgi:RsbT co-antagonist protein rsbRD N-terminal domain
MNLRGLLEEKKSSIVKKWVHAVFENYPADSTNFFLKQQDRFLNPVGHTISEGIRDIFNELLRDSDPEKFFPILNDIIKIKAVQDFTPSKALSFLFLLKKVIREEAGSEIQKKHLTDELTTFEAQIDQLILLSFDIYVKCRERIYELKTDDVRRMTYRLLRRANLICETQEEGSSPGEETVLNQKIKG